MCLTEKSYNNLPGQIDLADFASWQACATARLPASCAQPDVPLATKYMVGGKSSAKVQHTADIDNTLNL